MYSHRRPWSRKRNPRHSTHPKVPCPTYLSRRTPSPCQGRQHPPEIWTYPGQASKARTSRFRRSSSYYSGRDRGVIVEGTGEKSRSCGWISEEFGAEGWIWEGKKEDLCCTGISILHTNTVNSIWNLDWYYSSTAPKKSHYNGISRVTRKGERQMTKRCLRFDTHSICERMRILNVNIGREVF